MSFSSKTPFKSLAIILLTTSSLVVFAIQFTDLPKLNRQEIDYSKNEEAGNTDDPVTFTYDKSLLLKFEQLCQVFNRKKDYIFSGTIKETQSIDSSKSLTPIKFIMCRKGDNFYYQMGDAETINADGLCIMLDHSAKRIAISTQRGIMIPGIMNTINLEEKLRSEYYYLNSQNTGKETKLSIVNENHLTCKEYSITYNSLSSELTGMYTRLTDINHPSEREFDHEIEIQINNWGNKQDADNHLSKKVIIRRGREYELAAPYKDYELIRF